MNKNNTAQIEEGRELMKKGDKKLKGTFFSGIFSSKGERADQALENYKAAATKFKLANDCKLYCGFIKDINRLLEKGDQAAEAYLRCAECEKLSEGTGVGEYYVEASNMKKKTNKGESISLLEKAIDFFCNENRMSYAGKLQKQIAEIYEQEDQKDLASSAYEKAASIFELDGNASSDYFNMRIKVADYIADGDADQFIKAIKIYDEVAKRYSENKLTQGIAGNIYFKSLLLYLAINDSVGCEKNFDRYVDECPPFANTRQAKLIEKLIAQFNKGNTEQFSQECFEYNQIIALDRWQLRILNLAKEHLKKGFNPLGVEQHDDDQGVL